VADLIVTDMVYWVKRGNGYSERCRDEEVHMAVVCAANGWELRSFSAVC